MFRILSIDGGGIRGIIPAIILQRLLAKFPKLLDDVYLYAGTSTGGLIALSLAAGKPIEQIIKMYLDDGPTIFTTNWPYINGWFGCKYKSTGLRRVLQREFGDLELRDLKKYVLIPSFNLFSPDTGGWRPKFFTNMQMTDLNVSVLDVAMSTAAAPTYFPVHAGMVDGGVIANNPSVCALAQVRAGGDLPLGGEIAPLTVTGNGAKPVNQIVLLSLGTGRVTKAWDNKRDGEGLVQWAPRLLDILFDGIVDVPDYQCRAFLGSRYFRQTLQLPGEYPMDDVRHVKKLVGYAQEVDLFAANTWINGQWFDR